MARPFARLSTIVEKEDREKCAERSIDLLRRAVAKGYKDVEKLKVDKEFNALREREDFKKLISEMTKASKEQK